MLRAPGEQPSFHGLALDIVARLDLSVRLTNLRKHAFLIGHVGLDGVGDQEIRAAAGSLRQPGEPFLDFGFQADAKGRAACVRHEHIVAHAQKYRFCQRRRTNE